MAAGLSTEVSAHMCAPPALEETLPKAFSDHSCCLVASDLCYSLSRQSAAEVLAVAEHTTRLASCIIVVMLHRINSTHSLQLRCLLCLQHLSKTSQPCRSASRPS